jgi:hypothetical protein
MSVRFPKAQHFFFQRRIFSLGETGLNMLQEFPPDDTISIVIVTGKAQKESR